MTAKRRTKPYVPQPPRLLVAASKLSDGTTDAVTLETLASQVAELRLEVDVIVEWIDAFEQRLASEN